MFTSTSEIWDTLYISSESAITELQGFCLLGFTDIDVPFSDSSECSREQFVSV